MLACIAVLLTTRSGWGDELVQVAPHRAAMIGEPATPPLLGYLARPIGPGLFPAVVVLHWCSGFGSHDVAAALRLKSWGYVALALDSLGDANRCSLGGGSVPETQDAYAALHFLKQQKFIAADHIAVMGFSMGAIAALEAVETGTFERYEPDHFQAAIAYYPDCSSFSGRMTVPTLILIGEKDDWTLAAACQKMAAGESDIGITRTKTDGAQLQLVTYPGATHAFDANEPPRTYLGHFMEYDEAAARDADQRVRAFLKNELGGSP